MSFDSQEGVVEVAIGDRVFGVKGWHRGPYGVIALPEKRNDPVFLFDPEIQPTRAEPVRDPAPRLYRR